MTVDVHKSKLADSLGYPQVVDAQTHIADASEAHALNSTFSDTEVEAALDAIGETVNSILAVLEAHGFTKEA